jgi:hypothetical protein
MAVVCMSALGVTGQFGNQILQYAFLRMVADKHGYDIETRPWIGQQLFDIDDPSPTTYRCVRSTGHNRRHFPAPSAWYDPRTLEPCPDSELLGFCVYHTSVFADWRDRFPTWFPIREHLARPLETRRRSIAGPERDLIVLHARADMDFGDGVFFLTPLDWYRRWLDDHLSEFRDPVVYIATDRPDRVLPAFADWQPRHLGNCGTVAGAPAFFHDFHTLMTADVTLASNSTFPLAAAMLSERTGPRFRASRTAGGFVAYDPWDCLPYLQEVADAEQGSGHSRAERRRYYARRLSQPATLSGLARYGGGVAAAVTGARPLADAWLSEANRRFPMSDPLRMRLSLASKIGARVIRLRAASGDHAGCIDAFYEYSASPGILGDASLLRLVAASHDVLGHADVARQFEAAATALDGVRPPG